MRPRHLLYLITIPLLAVMVAACEDDEAHSNNDETGENGRTQAAADSSAASPQTPPSLSFEAGPAPLDDLAAPAQGQLVLPEEGLQGHLAIVYQVTLRVYDFHTDALSTLHEGIDPTSLIQSPDAAWLAYIGPTDETRNALVTMDVIGEETLGQTRIGNNSAVLGWSEGNSFVLPSELPAIQLVQLWPGGAAQA